MEALEFRSKGGSWGWDGSRVRMAWSSDPRASKWVGVRISGIPVDWGSDPGVLERVRIQVRMRLE